MEREPSLYELVWGEPPPETDESEPEFQPALDEPEPRNGAYGSVPVVPLQAAEGVGDRIASQPERSPDQPMRWRQGRPKRPIPDAPTAVDVSAIAVAHPVEPYLQQISADVEARISRALDGLAEMISRSQMTSLVAQSEARVLRALEALESRLNRPVTSSVPDLVVQERLDQMEAEITSLLVDLQRRLSDASERDEIDFRLKIEASENLRVVAAHLNEQLDHIHREVAEKLDALHSHTARRLGQIELRMQHWDEAEIE